MERFLVRHVQDENAPTSPRPAARHARRWWRRRRRVLGRAELRRAGAVPALLHAAKRAALCGTSFGEPFGVGDAPEQLQREARRVKQHVVRREAEGARRAPEFLVERALPPAERERPSRPQR